MVRGSGVLMDTAAPPLAQLLLAGIANCDLCCRLVFAKRSPAPIYISFCDVHGTLWPEHAWASPGQAWARPGRAWQACRRPPGACRRLRAGPRAPKGPNVGPYCQKALPLLPKTRPLLLKGAPGPQGSHGGPGAPWGPRFRSTLGAGDSEPPLPTPFWPPNRTFRGQMTIRDRSPAQNFATILSRGVP